MGSKQSADGIPRRTFVKGLAVGAAVAGLGLWRTPAFAQGNPQAKWSDLSGTDFDLRIGETPMNVTGNPRVAITVNGSIPAPTLHWREGELIDKNGSSGWIRAESTERSWVIEG